LLAGQVTDGFTTPLVGFFSDKINCKHGKRNTWYYIGSLLVTPTFLGIFLRTPGFLKSEKAEGIWYCIMASLFNIGWAFV
jgi:Na+/melibiose symporter-like transporter